VKPCKYDRIVLSVKWDGERLSQIGDLVAIFLDDVLLTHTYNPNKYTKKSCQEECSLLRYGCREHKWWYGKKPTSADCWQSAYRYQLEPKDKSDSILMLAIKESTGLGAGQLTEKKMAENMEVRRIEFVEPSFAWQDELLELLHREDCLCI